jgi:hypothetical protein
MVWCNVPLIYQSVIADFVYRREWEKWKAVLVDAKEEEFLVQVA